MEVKAALKRDRSKKKKKPDTKKVSLALFKEGKTIKAIARERSLVTTTIEGHLAHFIAKGELDVHQFLSHDQLKEILSKAEQLDSSDLKPIKEALEHEYSYGKLQMAMAYRENLKKQSEK